MCYSPEHPMSINAPTLCRATNIFIRIRPLCQYLTYASIFHLDFVRSISSKIDGLTYASTLFATTYLWLGHYHHIIYSPYLALYSRMANEAYRIRTHILPIKIGILPIELLLQTLSNRMVPFKKTNFNIYYVKFASLSP